MDWELVPLAGLEPARLSALDFESSASTNFATGAAAGWLDDAAARGKHWSLLEDFGYVLRFVRIHTKTIGAARSGRAKQYDKGSPCQQRDERYEPIEIDH